MEEKNLSGKFNVGAFSVQGVWRWGAFAVFIATAFIVNAATGHSWSMAFGYVSVPSLIGFFLIRRANTWSRLTFAYLIFVIITFGLIVQDAYNSAHRSEASILKGCQTRNQYALQLSTEAKKQAFCNCYASKMAWPLVRHIGLAFVTFRVPAPITQTPSLVSKATDAFALCSRVK